MTVALHLLLVEDSPLDAALVQARLEDAAADLRLEITHVETAAAANEHLSNGARHDCVLLDLTLPDAGGLEALAELHHANPDVPIVVLSGADAEKLAVQAVAEGAQDYLVKGDADGALILRSIRYALERKATQRELAAMALTDALTGLPNRARLMDRVAHALDRMARTRTTVALLFCDLDRFKLVNDSLGHSAGDRLLITVAERIQRAVRPSDTVARFGGDEFVVLCEDLHEAAEAELVVERIHAAVAVPVDLEGHDIVPTTSIGVAVAAPGDAPERLLRDADAAMYRAKSEGRGHAHFAEEIGTDVRERLALQTDLHRAIRTGELELHFQPQVSLADPSDMLGVEALLRWRHPTRGLLLPAAFIGAAEENGLIRPIGRWVLEEACRTLEAWDAATPGAGRLTMSVNLSPRQLAEESFVDHVAAVLARHAIEPGRLCLEITESVLLDSGGPSLTALERLRDLGVRLAMDDFGTGYASLTTLTRLPLHRLKIDRSFVAGMAADGTDARIVAAVASLAKALELEVVAEGVEDRAIATSLVDLGCTTAQGFAYGRPLPATELLDSLRAADRRRVEAVTRVLVCDDAAELRELVRASLEDDPLLAVVGERDSGDGIVEAVTASAADLVLIDLSMPRVDGLEAVAALRTTLPSLGIVVLSGFEADRMRGRALAVGADAYVEKRASLREVRRILHEVADARRRPRPLIDLPAGGP